MKPVFAPWRALTTATAGIFLAVALLSPPFLSPAGGMESHSARTTLLPNDEYAPALLQGIREARTSIVCCYYLFKIGPGRNNLPRRVAEELIRARQRGVEVTVILEKQGKNRDRLDADNRATAAFLSRGGVKVFFDSAGITTHVKATAIDARQVYVGSHNLTQSALRHNNEVSVLIDSAEMAAELRAYLGRL